ncbi:MAG TPA: TorF family putative porin [Gammaproteobacteria bacterium]|nr:TorF family putative porin [Gammaproteobacteria bacterium]
MKNYTKLLAGAIGLWAGVAAAADSPHAVTAQLGLTTDYVYRGISRSSEDPALQGGLEYEYEPLGLYAGVWGSSIEFDSLANDASTLELDWYGGLRGRFANGIDWDLGGIWYSFPDQDQDRAGDFDYAEARGQLGYRFANLPLTPRVAVFGAWSPDFFGEDGDGLYGGGNLDLTLPREFLLGFGIGHQYVDGDRTSGRAGYEYTHWRAGISRRFLGLNFDVSYHDSLNEDECGRDLCDERVVFSVSTALDVF